MNENRLFQRIGFEVETEVEISGTLYDATLVDISLKGTLVSFEDDYFPEIGTPCHLMVHLEMSDVTLYFTGVVIHTHEKLVGIKFITIDIGTMIHLRNLIELNSGDPDLVRHELNAYSNVV